MATITLAEIRLGARELADEETTLQAYVDDPELNRMVNRSIKRWYGMVAMAVPERYESVQTLTVTAATQSTTQIAATTGLATLPTDYMATLVLDYVNVDTTRIPLRLLQLLERNRFQSQGGNSPAVAYRVIKGDIKFSPRPTKVGEQYEHRYVPTAPILVGDTDLLDGINGWEQWVVYDAALQMLMKQETQLGDIRAERDRLGAEIEAAAALRVWGDATRIADTRLRSGMNHGFMADPASWWYE